MKLRVISIFLFLQCIIYIHAVITVLYTEIKYDIGVFAIDTGQSESWILIKHIICNELYTRTTLKYELLNMRNKKNRIQ